MQDRIVSDITIAKLNRNSPNPSEHLLLAFSFNLFNFSCITAGVLLSNVSWALEPFLI